LDSKAPASKPTAGLSPSQLPAYRARYHSHQPAVGTVYLPRCGGERLLAIVNRRASTDVTNVHTSTTRLNTMRRRTIMPDMRMITTSA